MKSTHLLAAASVAAAAILGSIALAVPAQDPAQQQQMQLPPGWTEQDMQRCMEAAALNENHQFLARGAGTWEGKTTMWMYPGAEPIVSTASSTLTPLMDGRYVQVEWKGEVPGMGPYLGMGIYGYDNVTQQFVATSIDSMGTGIAHGEGELSPDKKTLTWEYTYSCPVTGKPTTMREIQRYIDEDTMVLEMHGVEPKSRKEFKMMQIEMKRTGAGHASN